MVSLSFLTANTVLYSPTSLFILKRWICICRNYTVLPLSGASKINEEKEGERKRMNERERRKQMNTLVLKSHFELRCLGFLVFKNMTQNIKQQDDVQTWDTSGEYEYGKEKDFY